MPSPAVKYFKTKDAFMQFWSVSGDHRPAAGIAFKDFFEYGDVILFEPGTQQLILMN